MRASLTALLALALSTTAQAQKPDAWILHSNDILGELEPCGCRNNPQGGFAREWNWTAQFKSETAKDKPLWRVDTGDLLFNATDLPPLLKKQSEIQAASVLKAMNALHTVAYVPGEKDFALGTDKLLALIQKTSPKKLPYLAANLKVRKTGKLLFAESVILKTPSGKKVALFGVVGESLAWPKDLTASPALESARAQVKKLRAQADWVIALTHQGLEADEKLASDVKGLDAVIGAHSQSFIQTPITHQKALVLQTAFRNQWVGVLPLTQPLRAEDYRLQGLDLAFETEATAKPTPIDILVKDAKAAIAATNASQEAGLKADGATPRASHFQTFPACAECHLTQFVFWSRTHHVTVESV